MYTVRSVEDDGNTAAIRRACSERWHHCLGRRVFRVLASLYRQKEKQQGKVRNNRILIGMCWQRCTIGKMFEVLLQINY